MYQGRRGPLGVNIPMELTDGKILRYSRNILIREIGPEGQERIFGSSVLVVGAGGLGSPALLYLAAAGVGRIGGADRDRIEISNLNRQGIHTGKTVGGRKVVPLVHAGVLRFGGQLTTVIPGTGACLRCLIPEIPPRRDAPTCSESGILGAVAGIVGAWQAGEAIKVITGAGEPLAGRLLTLAGPPGAR